MKKDPDTKEGDEQVIQGGSWNDDPRNARVAHRYGYDPGYHFVDLGLRLARTTEPVSLDRSFDEERS